MKRDKTRNLSTVAGIVFATSLALGLAGCSGDSKNNRMFNGASPYSSMYGQEGYMNQNGLLGGSQDRSWGDSNYKSDDRDGASGGMRHSDEYQKHRGASDPSQIPQDQKKTGTDPAKSAKNEAQPAPAAENEIVKALEDQGDGWEATVNADGRVVVVDRPAFWKSKCDYSYDPDEDRDADGIHDDCEDDLFDDAKFITETGRTNGLAVKGLHFPKEHTEKNFKKWWKKLIKDSDRSRVGLNVVRDLFKDPSPTIEILENTQKSEGAGGYAYILGGYEGGEAVPFDSGTLRNPGSVSSFNGIGTNFETFSIDRYYMVAYDGYVKIPREQGFTGNIDLSKMVSGKAGKMPSGFMVFVDGNMELYASSLNKKDLQKVTGKIGLGECHHFAIVAVAGKETKRKKLFSRNMLAETKDGKGTYWQMLPTEMLSPTKPRNCITKPHEEKLLFAADDRPDLSGRAEVSQTNLSEEDRTIDRLSAALKKFEDKDLLEDLSCEVGKTRECARQMLVEDDLNDDGKPDQVVATIATIKGLLKAKEQPSWMDKGVLQNVQSMLQDIITDIDKAEQKEIDDAQAKKDKKAINDAALEAEKKRLAQEDIDAEEQFQKDITKVLNLIAPIIKEDMDTYKRTTVETALMSDPHFIAVKPDGILDNNDRKAIRGSLTDERISLEELIDIVPDFCADEPSSCDRKDKLEEMIR